MNKDVEFRTLIRSGMKSSQSLFWTKTRRRIWKKNGKWKLNQYLNEMILRAKNYAFKMKAVASYYAVATENLTKNVLFMHMKWTGIPNGAMHNERKKRQQKNKFLYKSAGEEKKNNPLWPIIFNCVVCCFFFCVWHRLRPSS